MPRLLQTLPIIALMAMAAPVTAQEEAAEGDAAASEAEAGAKATGGAGEILDMGRTEEESPTYIKEEYGDWQLKCFRSEAEEDPCQMYQLLTEDTGNPIAEISLFRLPEGQQAAAGATVVVPLGTLLTEDLKISVDDGRAKSYSYSFCSMIGCFARIGLTGEDVAAFKAGAEAQLQIVPAQAPNQTVDIRVSLNGFTAAYDNVSTVQN